MGSCGAHPIFLYAYAQFVPKSAVGLERGDGFRSKVVQMAFQSCGKVVPKLFLSGALMLSNEAIKRS